MIIPPKKLKCYMANFEPDIMIVGFIIFVRIFLNIITQIRGIVQLIFKHGERKNKWYIEEMKYIFISADGPIYVMLVSDNIANDLRGFVNLYYHQCYYKHVGPFDLMDDFLEFIKRKCPEHPGKIVEIIDFEDYEEEKRALKKYNYKGSRSWNF